MTQPLLIPTMMKMRWTIYLKSLEVKLIGSSLVKQQIKLYKNITGLHNGTKLKPLAYANLEYFRSFVHLDDFIP